MRDFANWAEAMNRVWAPNNMPYDYAAGGGSTGGGEVRMATLPVDVWATADGYHISAYLPGINPEDVEITFEADELTIRGQLPAAPEGADFFKRELYHGGFERRLNFNVPVNADAIEAHFSNGLLTLSVPKAEAVRPKQIKVQAK
jgi:HSP20 family protein